MPQSIYQRYAEAARKAGVSRNTKTSVDWFRKRIRKDRYQKMKERLYYVDIKHFSRFTAIDGNDFMYKNQYLQYFHLNQLYQ